MKTVFFTSLALLTAAVIVPLCVGCGKVIAEDGFTLELPALPQEWSRLMGEAHWRVDYFDAAGNHAAKTLAPGQSAVLDLPQTCASAVLAWPYWPEHSVVAGIFRPAGAFFPFDAALDGGAAGSLRASWRTGTEAFLYWELARAQAAAAAPKVPRLPANFNWPRFRELMTNSSLSEAVQADPWCADWRSIAAKIIARGYPLKTDIKAVELENTPLPVPSGIWIGTSPFTPPLRFAEGSDPFFPLRDETDTWVSRSGMVRANRKAWTFTRWN